MNNTIHYCVLERLKNKLSVGPKEPMDEVHLCETEYIRTKIAHEVTKQVWDNFAYEIYEKYFRKNGI